eukprot:7153324-Pyramimonas_sp.AAC.1
MPNFLRRTITNRTTRDAGNPMLRELGKLYKRSRLTPAEVAGLANAHSANDILAEPPLRRLGHAKPTSHRLRKGKKIADTRNVSRDVRRAFRNS